MKIVQNDNASLIECVKSWEKQIVNPNPGKLFQEVSDKNKGRKLSEFKSKAETALLFAETWISTSMLKLSNNSFESIKIDFSDTVKQYNYQDLANEEKKKLKDLIFILDRFGISDNAYNELSIFEKDLPRKTLINQCRDVISKSYKFQRTAGNIPGAYISFKEELIKYVKSNVSADSQVLKVKISGDGSKVSRI